MPEPMTVAVGSRRIDLQKQINCVGVAPQPLGFEMPRYFFNVYHDKPILDLEGEELPDMHAAWKEATVTAGRIIQDIDGELRPGQPWRLEVTDEFDNLLFEIFVSAKRVS